MSYIECFLVIVGAFSLVFGAGALVCVITEQVLQRRGFYDEEGEAHRC